ncbi:MAG TPA: thioesterase family protein [Microthrixaceae bacterium]|nr:thioesterase family protein [Microthrixaceae bacterium]
MTVEPGDILRDTTPTRVDGAENRFSAVIPEAWRIFYAFGGSTMAVALRVAEEALGRPELSLICSDATFCKAIPVGPVAADAEVVRQGRTGAQVLVRLWALDPANPDPTTQPQSDLMVLCVFGEVGESDYNFVGAVAPEVPDPDDCPDARSADDDSPFAGIPYHQQTEFRFAEGQPAWMTDRAPRTPEALSWFRFHNTPKRSDGTWEPATIALPGDILGTAVHAGAGSTVRPFLVISLQLGLQIVGEVRGDWILQHTRSQIAAGGYASGTAELYDEDRNLVAIATQCAKLRSM